MKNFVKFAAIVIVAVSATVASAADLEFHGYARVGLGFNGAGGNQIAFMLSESGKSKFRLGNEADWCLEPGFTMSFTKLDDKSAWGVHMLPATYRRMNNPGATDANNLADGGLNTSFKEFYFYGQNVPQLGGGEIWAGRRYFGRNYLGAINDSFLEAQDGIGAGVNDIPVGPAKLSFDIATPNALIGSDTAILDTNLSIGAHVTNIQTFNKDSNLQIWARVYLPMQKTSGGSGVAKRDTGFSASFMHVAGFGSAGNLTVAARYDQNAYTDQQDNGGLGKRNLEADLVYGVNIASARTSVDALLGFRQTKSVKSGEAAASADDTMNLILAGFRTDTQLSGPFRFLLEVGYDNAKTKGADKANTLLKITPCFAISGGNDPWSRPTFRLFYTYASWNKEAYASVAGAWKDTGLSAAYPAGKTSGSAYGIQAEGWW